MSSLELTTWQALWKLKTREAEHRQACAEDGEVVVNGVTYGPNDLPPDPDADIEPDDEEPDSDGSPE